MRVWIGLLYIVDGVLIGMFKLSFLRWICCLFVFVCCGKGFFRVSRYRVRFLVVVRGVYGYCLGVVFGLSFIFGLGFICILIIG